MKSIGITAVLALFALAALSPALAKDRKWLPAELTKIDEKQLESEETLYKSSGPNNTANAPLATAGAEKHVKKIFTYVFKTADKEYRGRVEKKPVEGLAAGAKLNVFVQHGWLIVQMPDGKEKKMDLE